MTYFNVQILVQQVDTPIGESKPSLTPTMDALTPGETKRYVKVDVVEVLRVTVQADSLGDAVERARRALGAVYEPNKTMSAIIAEKGQ